MTVQTCKELGRSILGTIGIDHMLDIDAINAELRDLSKSKGHTFEYDQNSGRYSISYWNASMDRVSEKVDFQAVKLLSHDELVTYLLQIVFKTREKQKLGRENIVQIVCPIITLSLFLWVLSLILGFIQFPLLIIVTIVLGVLIYILFRRASEQAIYKADVMTHTVRPGFVDVLNKLAAQSTNPGQASKYKKRANRLIGQVF